MSEGGIGPVQWQSASALSWDALADVVNRGYAGYFMPIHITPVHLQEMAIAWDIDLVSSPVALDANGQPVAIGLLGVRGDRGWIGAVAVAPTWRRHGIGRALVSRLIEAARACHLTSLTLEALIVNVPAIALYEAAGFRRQRELLSWERAPEMGALPVPDVKAERAVPHTLVADFAAWHATMPCWQADLPSLRARLNDCAGWVAREHGEPVAYALVAAQGDQVALLDVGVAPGRDARTTPRSLLQAIQLLHMDARLSLINLPAEDRLSRALAALGFRVYARQIEMGRETQSVKREA
jgi:GNAT superfamily N-acetyltransferase